MIRRKERSILLAVPIAVLVGFCASSCEPDNGTVGGSGDPRNGGGGGIVLTLASPTGAAGAAGSGGPTTASVQPWPPPGYVNITNVSYGAYALSPKPISAANPTTGTGGSPKTVSTGGDSATACGGLFGVVRDFKMNNRADGHPDFQHEPQGDDHSIVEPKLGADGKPVYASASGGTQTTTSATFFNQWYRDVPGVNTTYVVGLHFVQNGNVLTFAASYGNSGTSNSSFFPLDGQGFGNQGEAHNFAFTTEIHTSFTYSGGETFTFQGDDDVFVFINSCLAIDLGGIHSQQTKKVDLDAQATTLGITKGQVYPLAVFHAERHTSQSNFRVDTTMVFTDCGQVDGVPLIF